jgi:hypothetical protein
MSGTQTGFFDNLISAARDNPLSAALIGSGVLWLLVGDEKMKAAARLAATTASDVVDSGIDSASKVRRTAAPPTAPEIDHEARGAGETLRTGVGAASGSISEAADQVRDRFDEGVAYAREQFGKLSSTMPSRASLSKSQSSLGDMVERQPLLVGAVGLAIGAALAGAFRVSDMENEYIGELSDNAKGDLGKRGRDVSNALLEASDAITAEAGDAGAEVADRLKQAAADAGEAFKEKVKPALTGRADAARVERE